MRKRRYLLGATLGVLGALVISGTAMAGVPTAQTLKTTIAPAKQSKKTFGPASLHNIIGTTLLIVHGALQNEEGVIHVVAQRVEDYSHWVERLPRKSRDFH